MSFSAQMMLVVAEKSGKGKALDRCIAPKVSLHLYTVHITSALMAAKQRADDVLFDILKTENLDKSLLKKT